MKTNFIVLSALLSLSAIPSLNALASPIELVGVSNVKVMTETGCGQQKPDGASPSNSSCAPVTTVTFTVASGGSCYHYTAQIEAEGGVQVLSILESSAMPPSVPCTRPVVMNYTSTITASGQAPVEGGLVFLRNPIATQTRHRP